MGVCVGLLLGLFTFERVLLLAFLTGSAFDLSSPAELDVVAEVIATVFVLSFVSGLS
jgi:hypothetical protein